MGKKKLKKIRNLIDKIEVERHLNSYDSLFDFDHRQLLKMVTPHCIWPHEGVMSIWCVFWSIMEQMLTHKMVKVRRHCI